MARIYVSIGSNIERQHNIRSGTRMLADRFGPLILSTVYDSAPVGFCGDNFYNLVAGFDTQGTPESVITTLHGIEKAHGRARTGERFGPRTLDLDLLLYDNLVRHDAAVDLPRREILEHAFVLAPLAEIAPDGVHPETGQTFAELLKRLGPAGGEPRAVNFEFRQP